MDLGLTGKTALVTGADSGIGWQTARLLLAEGATVVLSDREQGELDAAVARLDAPEGRAHGFAADVTNVDELAALHEQVRDAVGEIDVLVQCAGVTGAQGPFHEIDDEGWVSTIETDLLGPVRLVREFLPDLRSGGWGRLVLTASEDAVQPYDDELPYCAAKAGVLAFAKGLSRSYALEGLLVNAVSPAFIETPMTAAMPPVPRELGRRIATLQQGGLPIDVAEAVGWLAQRDAAGIDGQVLRVCGQSLLGA